MIKTYRGRLADGGQQTIRLSTNKGLIGYRIKKLNLIDAAPGTTSPELIVKVYKYKQGTVDGAVNFSDETLIAVGYYASYATGGANTALIIFDNVTFNQDIYVTAFDVAGSAEINYYLELEQIELDLSEATVATLKDMRGTN